MRLAAIEGWNEPDQTNEEYLAGPEKPQRYAAILRAAYPAIKRANPNVPVLAGSAAYGVAEAFGLPLCAKFSDATEIISTGAVFAQVWFPSTRHSSIR